MKKLYYVVFVLMVSLLLTGFSCERYAIQSKFSQLADAGVRLDQAINQTHNAQGAKAQIDVAASLLSDLSNNQITGIKDDKTRLAVQAAIVSCQAILDNIAAFAQ